MNVKDLPDKKIMCQGWVKDLLDEKIVCQGCVQDLLDKKIICQVSARWEDLVNIMYLSLVCISSRGANCISHTILNCSYWNCVLQKPQAELCNLHNSVLQLDHGMYVEHVYVALYHELNMVSTCYRAMNVRYIAPCQVLRLTISLSQKVLT